MNKIQTLLLALAIGATASAAQAGNISDTGSGAYWGADGHGYGDVIGASQYDISGAQVSYSGSLLTIKIMTNFAGHAGVDTWAGPNGIGYGDLFLASAWTPNGADAHHSNDNAANGTKWTYGLSLDNRWSNTGGSFILYALQGATNAADIKNSESFLTCAIGSQCYYRNGQAVAVDTTSKTAVSTGVTGTWTVNANQDITFSLNTASTGLGAYGGLALHWGETCQNDVIEGYTVPEPGNFALLGIGMLGLVFMRRRRH